MMNLTQRVCLVALLSSIAATAGAQSAPAPAAAPPPAPAPAPVAPAPVAPAPVAPAPVAPAPVAPAPVAVPAPAPAPAPIATPVPAAPAPAPVESPVLLVPPAEPPVPPPPAPPSGTSREPAGHLMIGGAWNVAFPVGSVHHFTNAVSGLGIEFLMRYLVLPQLSIGASTDFQTFIASQPRTTYQLDNGALTATAYNSVRNAAVRATVHYYFLNDGPVMPYAGANIGVGWSTFQSSAADITLYDNQASVLLGGDVGVLFPLNSSNLALLTGFRYSALPAADFLAVTNVQSLTLQFGLLTL